MPRCLIVEAGAKRVCHGCRGEIHKGQMLLEVNTGTNRYTNICPACLHGLNRSVKSLNDKPYKDACCVNCVFYADSYCENCYQVKGKWKVTKTFYCENWKEKE
jgi:hypothetical protein